MSTADILIVVASCVLALVHIHGFIRRQRAERKVFEMLIHTNLKDKVVWPCAVCDAPFADSMARREHVAREHK